MEMKMELLNYLNNEIDYSECESLSDAADLAYEAFDHCGMQPERFLDKLLSELGVRDVGILFSDFEELDEAECFKTALGDALQFEEMAGKYPWDVAEVVVGLIMLHAKPSVRERLAELPYRSE